MLKRIIFLSFLIIFSSFIFISCSDDSKSKAKNCETNAECTEEGELCEIESGECKILKCINDAECQEGSLCDLETGKCNIFECDTSESCYTAYDTKWSKDKDLIECIDKFCVERPKCDPEATESTCKEKQLCIFKDTQNDYFCEDSCLETTDCKEGFSCEELENTELKACFKPVYVRGRVINNDLDENGVRNPIEGAFVTLFKTDDTFISNTMTTDEFGSYYIYIPVTRDNKGHLLEEQKDIFYKLRVSALNFQEYPSFIRVSIPFNLKEIPSNYIYESVLTTVYLFPLNIDNLKMISGKLSEELPGVLVVAENKSDLSLSNFGYTDVNGSFNIVNLNSGDYKVVAYKQEYNFSKEDIVISDLNLENITLNKLDSPLGSISGSVQIVNGGDGQFTSIVIVPKSTFDNSWRKGEFAPGLRAPNAGIEPNINGEYKIENIPEGDYVILAAFENDKLVQDPDESIAGTEIIHFSIPDANNNYDLTIDGFKITGALQILSPGATEIERIDELTEFKWVKDSSEDGYIIELFDSLGNKIFEKTVPKATEQLDYDGEALKKGYYYQWKVTSFRNKTAGVTYISKSEDLRGIFYIYNNLNDIK